MRPEPIACLRCTFPRTLRLGIRRVCFQCRYSWAVESHRPPAPRPSPGHAFTAQELRRLEVYRAAVKAGFYSDSLGD